VKLIALQTKYPECHNSYNVLYLVSSAMPKCTYELIDLAKRRGVRVVWNQNGVAYRAWAGDKYAQVNSCIRRAMHAADYVVYQSEFCRESADRFLGTVSSPWSVLYNPVDTSIFVPHKFAIPAEPWLILIAGTHQQRGRVLSVLKALRILIDMGRDAKVVLAGRLDWEAANEDLETWSAQMCISSHLEIKGSYHQAEAVELYQRAHVLVHSKYKDPCPTVVLEALSCGLPVIGSKSGAMQELVGHEAGVLLEVPDSWDEMHVPSAGQIARAITEVMDNREEYSTLARQRAVARFDVGSWLTEHGKIFANLVA
jgi:glycosyltransferase involved in cell wall biosynthesis